MMDIRDILRDIALASGAILALSAMLSLLGRTMWRVTIEPRLSKLDAGQRELCERLGKIEVQVTMNGARKMLPPELQSLPLADIVVLHIVETMPLIAQFLKEHEPK